MPCWRGANQGAPPARTAGWGSQRREAQGLAWGWAVTRTHWLRSELGRGAGPDWFRIGSGLAPEWQGGGGRAVQVPTGCGRGRSLHLGASAGCAGVGWSWLKEGPRTQRPRETRRPDARTPVIHCLFFSFQPCTLKSVYRVGTPPGRHKIQPPKEPKKTITR